GALHGLKVVAVAVVAQAVWSMARTLAPDRARATVALAAAVATLLWPTALGQVATIALAGLIGWRLLPRWGHVSVGKTSQTSRPNSDRGDISGWETPQTSRPVSEGPHPNPPHATRKRVPGGDPLPAPTQRVPASGYRAPGEGTGRTRVPFGRRTALVAWGLFFGLLVGLPLLRAAVPGHAIELLDTFYRVGSLVFGGGHVILPLLQAEVVPPGWVTREQFVAGYGAAQAVPGPLFTFAAYLGAVEAPEPNGWRGAALALIAIFVPSFLLAVGSLPFWDELRARPAFQDALRGINAAVVGLLLAALYQPVWTSAILGPVDLALALAALGLLALWQAPPWLVVLLAAGAGALLGLLQ
ncbi:MAG TPA: chromate efflux transporter, partial [Chloroflexota bacterium]